ncbi:MAG: ADOP family duplicated permease [Gemmatimonadaceae bacterium]
MKWFTRRLRALFRGRATDAEVAEEMRHHLAMEADDLARRAGISADEARRRALASFGGVARYQEEHRDARSFQWVEQTMQDLRHAARGLLRSPGFSLSAVLVLALGIGATTAVYSAVNVVLRNPSHETLAVIFWRGFPSLSTVDLQAIEAQQRSFSVVGGMRLSEAAFRASGEPERIRVGRVTSGFLRAIEARPAFGRLIESGDEPVGTTPVAVISNGLASRAFANPAAAVGQTITLDGIAHTVVGVLPSGGDMFTSRIEAWSALQLAQPTRRGPFGMQVLARLKPGVTFEAATTDVTAISRRVAEQWSPGRGDPSARFEALPIRGSWLADSSRMLTIFSVAVGLVLLIGVANVASLMLVRAIGRAHEVSLRSILGASRAKLVRLFVTESALISGAGAVAGLALGALGLKLLIAKGPQMPGLVEASLDLRAGLFAAAIAIAAGLVVGAYPVVMLLRRGTVSLSGDRAIGGRGTHALRSGFVVAQFALALPLLAMASLLMISFVRMQRVDPGFDPRNMLTLRVTLPAGQYGNDSTFTPYWNRALPLIRQVPGVTEAGLGTTMPPDDFGNSMNNFNLLDRPVAPGQAEPNSPWLTVSPSYFATLGLRLLEGRMFTPGDTGRGIQGPDGRIVWSGPPPAVIVSRSWARKHYPDVSPIGKTMISGGCTECVPTVVIGIVDDARYSGLDGTLEAIYSPVTEGYSRTSFVFVRTAGAPERLTEPVREVLRSLDPTIPLRDAATMEERLYRATAQPRQWASLLGGFAIAALGLAAIGVFGMLSYMVSTRQREIGVRMALGAHQGRVVQMIVRNGLLHAVAGSAVGLVAAFFGVRALTTAVGPETIATNVLFGVSANDPKTLTLVTIVLMAVALVACWLPARRAAAIDPLEAIRHN